MDKFKQKKIVALLAPIGLVAGLALSTQGFAASHGGVNFYAIDGGKGMVKNIAGECWNTAGGMAGPSEACGDKMPMEPAPMMATAPSDSDGDGVVDAQDKCPGTRAGAKVDQWGCEIIENVRIDLVEGEFDFDSAELKPGTMAALDDIADQVAATAGEEAIVITGHTDSVGPEAYNQGLSERRAQAAADHLVNRGISPSLLTVQGEGENNPIAENSTREGRAANRRIELMAE